MAKIITLPEPTGITRGGGLKGRVKKMSKIRACYILSWLKEGSGL